NCVFYPLRTSYILSCYFTSRAQCHLGAGNYLPTNTDPCLCDHLIYTFAGMEHNMIKAYDRNDEKLYGEFQALKNQNSNLKTLLSIGGWNLGTQKFTTMVSTAEYPGSRGSPPQDKKRFTVLLQELMRAFEEEGKKTNRPRLLLTAAVSARKETIDSAYQIGAVLDYIHVMTYDFHGLWEHNVGENSPLYKGPSDQGSMIYYNVDYAMNYWKNNGAPAEKLLVGFPTFGPTFHLASSNTTVGAPARGPGPAGHFTRQTGFLAYYEICTFLKEGATQAWDNAQNVPYAYNQGVWVGYDNIKSFQAKTEWLKQNGFGRSCGMDLALDDFTGMFCGQGRNPLINTLKTCKAQPNPPPAVAPSQQPSGGTTGSGFCAGKQNGLFPDPTDKKKFYKCNQGQTNIQYCTAGQVFDDSCKCCTRSQ
uniref:chitinase n=1 Tax=Maylandia zebra TaxID=106582 RepID=A0A3P9AUR8_9CICH